MLFQGLVVCEATLPTIEELRQRWAQKLENRPALPNLFLSTETPQAVLDLKQRLAETLEKRREMLKPPTYETNKTPNFSATQDTLADIKQRLAEKIEKRRELLKTTFDTENKPSKLPNLFTVATTEATGSSLKQRLAENIENFEKRRELAKSTLTTEKESTKTAENKPLFENIFTSTTTEKSTYNLKQKIAENIEKRRELFKSNLKTGTPNTPENKPLLENTFSPSTTPENILSNLKQRFEENLERRREYDRQEYERHENSYMESPQIEIPDYVDSPAEIRWEEERPRVFTTERPQAVLPLEPPTLESTTPAPRSHPPEKLFIDPPTSTPPMRPRVLAPPPFVPKPEQNSDSSFDYGK